MSKQLILILILFIFATSCGKKPEEEVEEAIDIALTYLSDNECNKAIDLLEDVGRDTKNAKYLQVLSSAYACRAGFSEIDFLDTEIDKLDTDDIDDLFLSLTKLKWSAEKEADSDEYTDLREALDIVLNVESTQPSQEDRNDRFGKRQGEALGVQALLMSMAQLGKFLHFYGNVDSTGVKGGGAANTDEQGATTSKCFAAYTSTDAQTVLTPAIAGSCRYPGPASYVGHPDLDFANLTETKRRMCEGLVLVTNTLDILENLDLSNSNYGDISAVKTLVQNLRTTITTADSNLGTLINTTSQETCETLVANATQWDNLQYIYALLFEVNLK